jgi:quercetin dioxygenase-like cupin family protein
MDRPATGPLIRTADDADVAATGVERLVMARGADTGGRISLAVVTYEPRWGGPYLHRHTQSDEMFFVLEGEFLFRAGEVERRVGPGAFVFVPAGTPHAFVCLFEKQSRQIVMFAPGGPELWFDELARLQAAGASREEIAAASVNFDQERLGPPLEVS